MSELECEKDASQGSRLKKNREGLKDPQKATKKNREAAEKSHKMKANAGASDKKKVCVVV